MAEASNWVTVNHTMVLTPSVAAVTPALAHGETDDKPRPTPRMSRISESAAAAAAPAAMAPHETALVERGGRLSCSSPMTWPLCAASALRWVGNAMFTPVSKDQADAGRSGAGCRSKKGYRKGCVREGLCALERFGQSPGLEGSRCQVLAPQRHWPVQPIKCLCVRSRTDHEHPAVHPRSIEILVLDASRGKIPPAGTPP